MNDITRQRMANGKRRIAHRRRGIHWSAQEGPMMAAGNIQYEIAQRSRGLTCGGIGAVHLLARRTGLIEAINEVRLNVWSRQRPEFFGRAVIDAGGTLAPTWGQCKEGMDISYKGQCALFHELRYFFYITNDYARPAEGIVPEANGRCNQENLIEQLKNGARAMEMPVGKPYTRGIDGHQCWIGTTGKVLLTTEDAREHGNLYIAAPGETAPKLLGKGFHIIHLSVSPDGRFFVADHAKRIFLGSIRTGRVLPFCDPRVSWGGLDYTHPHAYLTPDNRHVIFNSDCTGICQVYAAQIPAGTLEYLEDQV